MDAVTWAVPAFITVGTFLMSCYLLRSFVVARATMRKYVRVVGVVVDFRSRQVASANTRHPEIERAHV